MKKIMRISLKAEKLHHKLNTKKNKLNTTKNKVKEVCKELLEYSKEEVKYTALEIALENTDKIGEFLEKNFEKLKIVDFISKGTKVISHLASPITYAIAAVLDFKERRKEGKNLKEAIVETAISTGFWITGSIVGEATLGKALGKVLALSIGGPIGIAIGEIVGSFIGSVLFEYIADKLVIKNQHDSK